MFLKWPLKGLDSGLTLKVACLNMEGNQYHFQWVNPPHGKARWTHLKKRGLNTKSERYAHVPYCPGCHFHQDRKRAGQNAGPLFNKT